MKSYAVVIPIPDVKGSDSNGIPNSKIDLTDDAFALLKPEGGAILFRQLCGDGYVAQITYGGELYATYNFSSLDYQRKTHLSASANVSTPGDVFSASGHGNLDVDFQQKDTKTSIREFERGGAPDQFPSTRDQVVADYTDFQKSLQNNERPLYMLVVKYSSLPSLLKQSPLIQPASDLDAMITGYLRLKTLLDNLNDSILEREDPSHPPATYFFRNVLEQGYRTIGGMKDLQKGLQGDVTALSDKIRSCLDDPKNCAPDDTASLISMSNELKIV